MFIVLYHAEERYIQPKLTEYGFYSMNVSLSAVKEYQVRLAGEELVSLTCNDMHQPSAEHLLHGAVVVLLLLFLYGKPLVCTFQRPSVLKYYHSCYH